MPFTLAHPAAAVPFSRKGLVLSALVVGSMAPDFQYFLGLVPGVRDVIALFPVLNFSHTPVGLFLFCLPVGLALLWLFHRFLKLPLLSLLPASHQHALLPYAGNFSFAPWRRLALILLSLWLGALTHIFWDSFTHSYGWFVQAIPLFTAVILQAGSTPIYTFTLLQHVSTLVGMALLGIWYWRRLRMNSPDPTINPAPFLPEATRLGALLVLILAGILLAGIYRFPGWTLISDLHGLRWYVGETVVTGMLILFGELLLFSGLWHFVRAKGRQMH